MRKLVVVLFFSVIGLAAFGQDVKKVQLLQSETLRGNPSGGTLRVIKPIFSHEGSTLSADSANFNQTANTFDAFGTVVITQTNGTTVYSDALNYNGNTRVALLTRNVRLVDGTATLTTDRLSYNMGTRIGTYTGGGKIVNEEDVLTSKSGYYFANSNDAYFRYDVDVMTPDAHITTDTLRYNSVTKIAYFYGPTNIYGRSDSTRLYTENGSYHTVTEQAFFGKKNLYTQGSKSLKGDSLFYDGKTGFGRAINNITFIDTAEKIILKGGLGVYNEADESTLVTRNAYVIFVTENDSTSTDSIYMTADTLFTRIIPMNEFKRIPARQLKSDTELGEEEIISPGEEGAVQDSVPGEAVPAADSLAVKPKVTPPVNKTTAAKGAAESTRAAPPAAPRDTIPADTGRTRIVMAYHKVRLFKSDLQARADSIFFGYADSTLRCFTNPMLWAEGSQLSADTIYLQLKNRQLDNMLLNQNSFIVNVELDSSKFNQVKGKTITGLFHDNKLRQMFVDGNAESVYYTVEDSAYSGMNYQVSSRMRVRFNDNKMESITSVRKPEGSYYPMDQIPEDREVLEGFIWKPKDRPRSKEEIIPSLRKNRVKNAPKKPAKKPAAKPVARASSAKKPGVRK